jgi:hypothetical protein
LSDFHEIEWKLLSKHKFHENQLGRHLTLLKSINKFKTVFLYFLASWGEIWYRRSLYNAAG